MPTKKRTFTIIQKNMYQKEERRRRYEKKNIVINVCSQILHHIWI